MENNNQKGKKDYSGAIAIILLLSLAWGLPSLIHGHGFINGIIGNIKALLVLSVIGIIGYVIYKNFLEKK